MRTGSDLTKTTPGVDWTAETDINDVSGKYLHSYSGPKLDTIRNAHIEIWHKIAQTARDVKARGRFEVLGISDEAKGEILAIEPRNGSYVLYSKMEFKELGKADQRDRQTALLITAMSAALGYGDAAQYPPTSVLAKEVTEKVFIANTNAFGKHALAVFGSSSSR